MPARRWTAPLALALAIALVACSAAPPEVPAIGGTVVQSEDLVLGVGMWLVAPDGFGSLTAGALGPAAFLEFEPGQYLGELVPVGADGAFDLPLPNADDIPEDVLIPAAEALINFVDTPACEVVVSDPSVLVSAHASFGASIPGLYLVTAAYGWSVAIAADAEIDTTLATMEEALAGRSLYAWLYADRPVSITAEGCDFSGGVTGSAELNLCAGWNRVAWVVNDDVTRVSLVNDASTALVVTGYGM
jgi:hypothetical protein